MSGSLAPGGRVLLISFRARACGINKFGCWFGEPNHAESNGELLLLLTRSAGSNRLCGILFLNSEPKQKSKRPQIELWSDSTSARFLA
jgi:hypothetical protein